MPDDRADAKSTDYERLTNWLADDERLIGSLIGLLDSLVVGMKVGPLPPHALLAMIENARKIAADRGRT